LIQIVLAFDIVFAVGFIVFQFEDCDERDGRAVKGYKPDAEDLRELDVEEEGGFVERWKALNRVLLQLRQFSLG